jgi:hypothetical protein
MKKHYGSRPRAYFNAMHRNPKIPQNIFNLNPGVNNSPKNN